ncbi:oxygen-regulated invasion protein [Erwinia tasmaniensis Et1/99]|uniref:Oxygen-regulated invasion protein n=2 Tax=Erwinia tasmaniensis TaxID=338565 RepID=B2VID4_ERWT9|nr:oxygen-regulated invasion protein [Erwinia tasmaniensis Et1/99]
MLRILYSPLNYTHPSHLQGSVLNLNSSDSVLINFWIITHFKLKDLPQNWEVNDNISLLLLDKWELINDAACLIGGYLLRSRILKQCTEIILNPRLSSFISLPIPHHVSLTTTGEHSNTLSLGLAFILSQIPHFPLALKERVLLFLPAEIDLPDTFIARNPNHLNLLTMALNYAKNYRE